MKQLYYIYLRLFKGFIKVDDLGYRLIKLVALYGLNEPQVIRVSKDQYLIGPPKRKDFYA